MSPSTFSCESDIQISYPYNGDKSVWAFWAAHNCEDYNLMLSVVFTEEAIDKFVGFYGAGLSSKGCTQTEAFADTVTCEFELDRANKGFSIMFAGGFTPVFYLTEWEQVVKWEDSFNWW